MRNRTALLLVLALLGVSLSARGERYHLAVLGDGLFCVRLANDTLAYTHNGAFLRDARGRLTDTNGHPVEPPVIVPPQAKAVSISADGQVVVLLPAQANAQSVGQLLLTRFANPSSLRSLGNGLFAPTANSGQAVTAAPGLSGLGILRMTVVADSADAKPTKATVKAKSSTTKRPAASETEPKGSAPAGITVTVRAVSEVAGDKFTLGDLADITGKDKALISRLAVIAFGPSPLPGLTRTLFPGEVTVRLRANHLDENDVAVILPPSLQVTRASTNVAADDITKAALAAAGAALKDAGDIRLEPAQPSQNVTLPPGKLVMVTGTLRGQVENGSVTVPISLMVDGKPSQSVDVVLRVHRKAKVLVARRTVETNEILARQDVELVSIELPLGFVKPISRTKDVIGKRARRRLNDGAPISSDWLEMPPAILANDAIRIEYVFGAIRIITQGVARQAGAIGDTIRVCAADSRKDLNAVIVDRRTVRIGDTDETQQEPESPADTDDKNEEDHP